jgi:hypothetical protein
MTYFDVEVLIFQNQTTYQALFSPKVLLSVLSLKTMSHDPIPMRDVLPCLSLVIQDASGFSLKRDVSSSMGLTAAVGPVSTCGSARPGHVYRCVVLAYRKLNITSTDVVVFDSWIRIITAYRPWPRGFLLANCGIPDYIL